MWSQQICTEIHTCNRLHRVWRSLSLSLNRKPRTRWTGRCVVCLCVIDNCFKNWNISELTFWGRYATVCTNSFLIRELNERIFFCSTWLGFQSFGGTPQAKLVEEPYENNQFCFSCSKSVRQETPSVNCCFPPLLFSKTLFMQHRVGVCPPDISKVFHFGMIACFILVWSAK